MSIFSRQRKRTVVFFPQWLKYDLPVSEHTFTYPQPEHNESLFFHRNRGLHTVGLPPKSAKERQKQWRDRKKLNAAAHEEYLQRERGRYARRKETGSRKCVKDMTPREHRRQKHAWKRDQRVHRERVKTAPTVITPPPSPGVVADQAPAPPQPSNAARGRRKVPRDRSKAYRTINKLTVKLETLERSAKRIQKRYERAQKKISTQYSEIQSQAAAEARR